MVDVFLATTEEPKRKLLSGGISSRASARSYIFGLARHLPAMETHHPSERPMTTKVSNFMRSKACLSVSYGGANNIPGKSDIDLSTHPFEVLGVQATQEVQAAGRKVVMENTHLRSLLKLHGVTDQDIQEYLAARSTNISLPTFQSGAVPEARSHTRKSRNSNNVSDASPQPSLLEMHRKSPSDMTAAAGSTLSLPSPAIHQQMAFSEGQISRQEAAWSYGLSYSWQF
ncbi:hypothetical protein ETB97_009048 [Aspergillus alliaceus]|uniref:Uncharacterized protein n=1 Tax=Petromyces alliaceus TaxID=209559 RepID=A0A8H6E934_PETAA|nr:hypothetical protein ETB97_009048 [Aspergillus burnettii]